MAKNQFALLDLRRVLRVVMILLLLLAGAGSVGVTYLINNHTATLESETSVAVNYSLSEPTDPFPLGVDPQSETITEQGTAATYLEQHFASEFNRTQKVTWVDRLYEKIAYLPLYQTLASPNSRILVIFSGQRKEEIAKNFGKILGWDKTEQAHFVELVTTKPIELADGTFYPGKYVTSPNSTPEEVAVLMQETFKRNVLDRYPESIESVLPLEETLIIASLIEREARSFDDMRAVSGVIWNRLFIDMRLQVDATLQYARGSRTWEPDWWPVPVPRDKFIDSPFNTYLNEGLPPSPIANPSAAAIIAALNPQKTECLFYFHDDDGLMHCSATYEEHKEKLTDVFSLNN